MIRNGNSRRNSDPFGLVCSAGLVALLLTACSAGGEQTLGVTSGGDGAGAAPAMAYQGRDAAPDGSVSDRPAKIENPTMKDLLVAGPLGDRTLGRSDAPVTVIEYASLTCPHCRAFHEQAWDGFKRAYIDTGKVHYILREFPIGRSSGNAWLVTRCADERMMHRLFDLYLRRQARWVSQEVRVDAIYAVAREAGMSRAQFDSCLQNQDVINHIKWVKERGRQLGVIGTPTFFINDRQVRSVTTLPEMRALIDPLLGAQVASN